jgi:hypothetical protein
MAKWLLNSWIWYPDRPYFAGILGFATLGPFYFLQEFGRNGELIQQVELIVSHWLSPELASRRCRNRTIGIEVEVNTWFIREASLHFPSHLVGENLIAAGLECA